MFNPINLNAAFRLAKIQDEYIWAARRSVKGMGSSFERGQFDTSYEMNRFQKLADPIKKVFFYLNG